MVSYWCIRRTQYIPQFGDVLQEMGILLGGCLTVKNQWGLLTGDDGVGLGVFISLTLLLANLQMDSVNYGIQGLNFTC